MTNTDTQSLADELLPRIGQKVRIADHCADSELWNRQDNYVVGLTTEIGKPGVNVWVSSEYPMKSEGPTDGYWVNRGLKPDDLQWNTRATEAPTPTDDARTPDDVVAREIVEMRRKADDWRRPNLAQVEGPNDLKIYGGTIAEDIERWANLLAALTASEDAKERALRPFAAFADPRRKMPADMTITQGSAMATRQLKMGDCYAAADALLNTTTPGEGK